MLDDKLWLKKSLPNLKLELLFLYVMLIYLLCYFFSILI